MIANETTRENGGRDCGGCCLGKGPPCIGGRSMLAVNCHEMIYNSVLRSMDDIAQD